MSHPSYPAILQQLAHRQDDPYDVPKLDLLALGITTEMVPDLIATILDDKYYGDYDEEGYAHLFAYIALGQLKTTEAIDGLILGVKKWSHTDWFEWFCEAMPIIFARVGEIAIPALIELLDDRTLGFDPRTSAIHYLYEISAAEPATRDRCLAPIAIELERSADNDPEFNGYLVMTLVADFKAIETAPQIEAAYAADRIDPQFIGDWEDVQVSFGLIPERITPKPNYFLGRSTRENRALDRAFAKQSQQIDSYIENKENRTKNTNLKNKAKRKQEKKSRQKNRRK
jgi:Protein of unknown function (DUF1186)